MPPLSRVAWDAAGLHAPDLRWATERSRSRPVRWHGGPRSNRAQGGGVEFVQAQEPPAPLARFSVHEGTCLALAADPEGGFLSGGDDGRLVHLNVDGTSEVLVDAGGEWIDLVATSPVRPSLCN